MNEPYQRVSQDNSVFDGALIGAAIGMGGAGAGVFGVRMHYSGIDNRVKREQKRLQNEVNFRQSKVDQAEKAYGKTVDKAGPRFYERRGYNKGNQAEANIVQRGNRMENVLSGQRQRDLESLQNQMNAGIDGHAEHLSQRYPTPKETLANTNQDINRERNEYVRRAGDINQYYDDQASQVQQRTAQNLNNNSDVQYRNKVNDRINQRIDKKHSAYMDRINEVGETAAKLGELSAPGYADSVRSKHMYSKMGGWRNAGIIGASSVIGAGAGMLGDQFYN